MEATKIFKHMAWANQEIISRVGQLPDAALDSFVTNPEWTAREILRHITSSASWYGFRLMKAAGAPEMELNTVYARLEELNVGPATSADVSTFVDALADADAILLEQSLLPEADVVREVEGKTIIRKRSTILAQSIHHATEHRAQLIFALEAGGYSSINLDDYDLWAYCDKHGE